MGGLLLSFPSSRVEVTILVESNFHFLDTKVTMLSSFGQVPLCGK
jgi:hypothetical protein